MEIVVSHWIPFLHTAPCTQNDKQISPCSGSLVHRWPTPRRLHSESTTPGGREGVRCVDISQTHWPLRNEQTRICTSWTSKFCRVHRCHLKSQDWVWVRRRTDRGLVLRSAQSPRRVSTQVAACMCRRSRLLPYIHIRTYTQKHTSRTCMHGIHRYTHAYVNTCTCIYRGVEVGVGGTVQYSTLGAHIHSTQTYIRVRAHIHTDAKYMHTHAYIHT